MQAVLVHLDKKDTYECGQWVQATVSWKYEINEFEYIDIEEDLFYPVIVVNG